MIGGRDLKGTDTLETLYLVLPACSQFLPCWSVCR